jgi:hypothetical protein
MGVLWQMLKLLLALYLRLTALPENGVWGSPFVNPSCMLNNHIGSSCTVVGAVVEADNTESDANCPLFFGCAFVSDHNDAANHLSDRFTRSFSAF